LDPERNAGERTAIALADLAVGLARHGASLLGRLQHEGIKRTRFLDRLQMGIGQLKRGERLFREAIPGLGERHRREQCHLLIGLQKNGERVLSLAGSSFLARSRSCASSWSSTASIALSGSASLPCRRIASRKSI